MGRSAQARLAATPNAVARGEAFKARVGEAVGDVMRLADLMAEAIGMLRESNGLDPVRRDGLKVVSIESIIACHCLLAARDAYVIARGKT